MDVDSSAKFIGSLTKFLQSLCNGYVEFQRGVELVGHIYLSIDTGEKVDYILHEKVSKNDENSVTFVSNSFHAQPLDKDKTKDASSKLDAKGSDETLHDGNDDDDIMIVDHSKGAIGSTNSGSVSPRGLKRMVSPSSEHRQGQRIRISAGLSSAHSQNSSGRPFTSGNRQHSGRPSSTVTSQGASHNENINMGDVKLEQISRDELLTLASQVGDGASVPPHSSSSRSQPHHSGTVPGDGRGDTGVWVKQEVPDDGGGGSDAGWSQERDDSNSNSGSNLYPVMLHQNPAAFPSSAMSGFSGPSTSGNQSAANPFPMPGTSQDMSGLDPAGLRIMLLPVEKQESETNAEYSKTYQERLKKNSETYESYRELNKQKCKEYRNLTLTEEQLQIQREKEWLRTQKFREAAEASTTGNNLQPVNGGVGVNQTSEAIPGKRTHGVNLPSP